MEEILAAYRELFNCIYKVYGDNYEELEVNKEFLDRVYKMFNILLEEDWDYDFWEEKAELNPKEVLELLFLDAKISFWALDHLGEKGLYFTEMILPEWLELESVKRRVEDWKNILDDYWLDCVDSCETLEDAWNMWNIAFCRETKCKRGVVGECFACWGGKEVLVKI